MTAGGPELTWHALNTRLYHFHLYHFASDVLFYAVTIVDCPREIQGVCLAIGPNAAFVWWVNGQEAMTAFPNTCRAGKGRTQVRAILNGGGPPISAPVSSTPLTSP